MRELVRARRWAPVAAAFMGVVIAVTAIVATWRVAPYPLWVWLPIQLGGLSFTCCGALLWWYRPAHGTGPLMVAVGLTWYLGDLQLAPQRVLFAVGFCLYYLSSTILAHLVLALPTGRLGHRYERRVVRASYLAPLLEIPRFAVEYPAQPQGWPDRSAELSVLAPVGSMIALILTVLTLALVIRRWAVAGQPVRREYTLVWMAIVALAVVFVIHPVSVIVDPTAAVRPYLLLAHAVGLFVVPVTIAVGLLRVRLVRLRVAELVVRLETARRPKQVRAALAHALDDPSLEMWFPAGDGPVEPVPLAGRAVTVVEGGGAPLAILRHDPALLERQPLVDAVVAAARLALTNARVLSLADAERRRIQRDLHDGVQHKLLTTGMLVDRVRRQAGGDTGLAAVATQLDEVIGDVRALAAGIHPPALAEQGVAAAVEALAERAPLPVLVDIPQRRFAEHLERAAYFIVAEALSNVYKHARADRVRVRAQATATALVLDVTDDGIGGADPGRGTGLRGMHDRVRALRGRLRIDSSPGSGTRVVAELPCEW